MPQSTSSAKSNQLGDPRVIIHNDHTDIEYLKTEKYGDCVVVIGNEKRKAHKAFLSRIPYFTRQYLASTHLYTFGQFEEYEVWWLLQYVYSAEGYKKLHIPDFAASHPRRNGLDTRIRLVQLARFYKLAGLEKNAIESLQEWCQININLPNESLCLDFGINVEVAMASAFGKTRNTITPDIVKVSVGNLIKKHATLLHSRKSFCNALQKMEPKLRSRVALKTCGNCP